MKRYCIGLVLAGFLGTLAAQEPNNSGKPLPATPVATGGPQVNVPAGPVLLPAGQCCLPTRTVCCPEPATKIIIKPVYSAIREPICVPKCPLIPHRGCCENCPDYRPYHRGYLVKRLAITECDTYKGVPHSIPDCWSGRVSGCLHPAGPSEPIPAPQIEVPGKN